MSYGFWTLLTWVDHLPKDLTWARSAGEGGEINGRMLWKKRSTNGGAAKQIMVSSLRRTFQTKMVIVFFFFFDFGWLNNEDVVQMFNSYFHHQLYEDVTVLSIFLAPSSGCWNPPKKHIPQISTTRWTCQNFNSLNFGYWGSVVYGSPGPKSRCRTS